MPTLTTIVTFDYYDGSNPYLDARLINVAGDLFGTTIAGGPTGGPGSDGTVFEITKTDGSYVSTPITLVSFNGANENSPESPEGNLTTDAAGDLFSTTWIGGANGDGTVFEIPYVDGSYAGTPTTLFSFNGTDGANPSAGLVANAAGDLFGTTDNGGTNGGGTVFEIPYVAGSYASVPTTLVNFNITDGESPVEDVFVDAAGDLLGTTQSGGAHGDGTVFEIAYIGGSYASTPTTLVSFGGTNGNGPSSLIADAAGDLFGSTGEGGAHGDGTVFEIVKTASGYSSAPTTLVSFNGTDGDNPGSLIVDAAGDLFGITDSGGASGEGTVFEVPDVNGSYASTPITLVTFSGANGAYPVAGLLADTAGDLFGPTQEGFGTGYGTVFELTAAGFQVPMPTLSGGGNNVNYTPEGAAVAFDAGLGVSDASSAALVGATISVGSGFQAGDTLTFTNQNGIAGSYNATTGVLTLMGSAGLAAYQTALDAITFSSTSGDPTDAGTDLTRTVTSSITDGTLTSNTVTVTIIVGTELHLFGNGLDNILVRHASGQLVDEGFNDEGIDTWTEPLTNPGGNAFTLPSAATIAGTALNLFGNGLENLFVLNPTGQLVDQGFTNAGVDTWTQPLTNPGGSAFTITQTVAIVGTAQNLFGNGLENLFVFNASGQLVDQGFTSTGVDTWTQPLTDGPSVPFTIAPSATIAGAAQNFFGNGLENIFVLDPNGQLVDQGFTSAGADTWTQPLTVAGGGAFNIAASMSVVGVGQSFLATGGSDLFLRGASGQLSVSEFNHSGTLTGGTTYPALGDADTGQVLIGTTGNDTLTGPAGASTLIGDGGSDTYGFGASATRAVVINGTTGNGAAQGTLDITATDADTSLWLDRVDDTGAVSATGNNLRIDVLGTQKSVTVDGWFAAGDLNAQLAQIVLPNAAGGALTLDTGVATLVQAMATFEASYATSTGSAFDPTSPANAVAITGNATLATATGSAWHH